VVLVVESEVAELAEAAVSLSFSPELSLENSPLVCINSKGHQPSVVVVVGHSQLNGDQPSAVSAAVVVIVVVVVVVVVVVGASVVSFTAVSVVWEVVVYVVNVRVVVEDVTV